MIEDPITEAIERAGVGEFDGHAIGPAEATLYMWGPDADALWEAIESAVRRSTLGPGSYAIRRYGPPGASENRVDLASAEQTRLVETTCLRAEQPSGSKSRQTNSLTWTGTTTLHADQYTRARNSTTGYDMSNRPQGQIEHPFPSVSEGGLELRVWP